LCIEQKYQNITQVDYRAIAGGMVILFAVPAGKGAARHGGINSTDKNTAIWSRCMEILDGYFVCFCKLGP